MNFHAAFETYYRKMSFSNYKMYFYTIPWNWDNSKLLNEYNWVKWVGFKLYFKHYMIKIRPPPPNISLIFVVLILKNIF